MAESVPWEEELERTARQAAERSAREQGLPARVTDPEVVERVAAIVRLADLKKAA